MAACGCWSVLTPGARLQARAGRPTTLKARLPPISLTTCPGWPGAAWVPPGWPDAWRPDQQPGVCMALAHAASGTALPARHPAAPGSGGLRTAPGW